MANIKVGDTVEIINDYEPWNGTIATVKSIGADPEFPYELVVVKPGPRCTRKVGENIAGWPEENLRLTRDRTAQEQAIESEFPHRMDVFWSEHSDCAVVMDMYGNLRRILADGTIDH